MTQEGDDARTVHLDVDHWNTIIVPAGAVDVVDDSGVLAGVATGFAVGDGRSSFGCSSGFSSSTRTARIRIKWINSLARRYACEASRTSPHSSFMRRWNSATSCGVSNAGDAISRSGVGETGCVMGDGLVDKQRH